MRWSWKIARIKGIDVSIHATFGLILIWAAIVVWKHTQNPVAVAQGIAFVLLLFVCVVLHEFGHALTARRFGITTRSITLLPIGGVAAMEKMPEDPRQEMLVAVAGPAVNLAIAGVLALGLLLSQTPPPVIAEDAPPLLFAGFAAFIYQLLFINILLAVFNMVPAFPMDGGRVLRAALALRMDHAEATRRAATVGQMLALLMFVLGLLYNPFLMLIAVFVWLGASAESSSEQLQAALARAGAEQSMVTQFECLDARDALYKAIDLTLHTDQKHYPVTRSGEAPRLLTQKQLLQALREHSEHTPVGALDLPKLETVDIRQPMNEIVQQLQRCPGQVLGVTEGNRLSGLIHLENIIELMRIDEALQAHRQQVASRRSY